MEDFIRNLQDLRHLDWVNKKISIGTPGCFLKAYEEIDGVRIYYKMSNYDSYRGIIWKMIWERWKQYVEICN